MPSYKILVNKLLLQRTLVLIKNNQDKCTHIEFKGTMVESIEKSDIEFDKNDGSHIFLLFLGVIFSVAFTWIPPLLT